MLPLSFEQPPEHLDLCSSNCTKRVKGTLIREEKDGQFSVISESLDSFYSALRSVSTLQSYFTTGFESTC